MSDESGFVQKARILFSQTPSVFFCGGMAIPGCQRGRRRMHAHGSEIPFDSGHWRFPDAGRNFLGHLKRIDVVWRWSCFPLLASMQCRADGSLHGYAYMTHFGKHRVVICSTDGTLPWS